MDRSERFHGMSAKTLTPKVGVGVVLRDRNQKILLMLRKGAHGEGLWSLPGGHMELGEDFLDVCKREVMEEVGVTVTEIQRLTFTNDIFEKEGLHYVTLFFEAKWNQRQQVRNVEPEKCSEIRWFTRDELDTLPNLFAPLAKVIDGNRAIKHEVYDTGNAKLNKRVNRPGMNFLGGGHTFSDACIEETTERIMTMPFGDLVAAIKTAGFFYDDVGTMTETEYRENYADMLYEDYAYVYDFMKALGINIRVAMEWVDCRTRNHYIEEWSWDRANPKDDK